MTLCARVGKAQMIEIESLHKSKKIVAIFWEEKSIIIELKDFTQIRIEKMRLKDARTLTKYLGVIGSSADGLQFPVFFKPARRKVK